MIRIIFEISKIRWILNNKTKRFISKINATFDVHLNSIYLKSKKFVRHETSNELSVKINLFTEIWKEKKTNLNIKIILAYQTRLFDNVKFDIEFWKKKWTDFALKLCLFIKRMNSKMYEFWNNVTTNIDIWFSNVRYMHEIKNFVFRND